MMSARSSSSEKGASSSTTSGDKTSGNAGISFLCQIKENFFDIDLIQIMTNNANACIGLKELVKKVDILTVSSKVSKVVIESGFLIDHFQADHFRK